jgi:hypothetical protein
MRTWILGLCEELGVMITLHKNGHVCIARGMLEDTRAAGTMQAGFKPATQTQKNLNESISHATIAHV